MASSRGFILPVEGIGRDSKCILPGCIKSVEAKGCVHKEKIESENFENVNII